MAARFSQTTPTGELQRTFYRPDGQVGSTVDQYGKVTKFDYYGPLHPSAGKLSTVWDPAGKTVTYAYSSRGETTEIAGTAASKVTYQYDEYGKQWKMFTWRDATTADETRWNYEASTGLLLSKRDAAGKEVSFTYTTTGKLATRTWARGAVTTFSYDYYGSLTDVDYSSDGGVTPDVTLSNYDRLGRPRAIEQTGLGTEIFSYQPGKGTLDRRYYSNDHALLPERGIDYSPVNAAGQSTGYDETTILAGYPAWGIDYTYDTVGRLDSVSDGINKHLYTYKTDSAVVSTIESKSISTNTAWFKESRATDVTGRLIGIRSDRMNGSTLVAPISMWSYDYDSVGRRNKATFQDGSSWEYNYDDRSQVTLAVRKNSGGTEIPELRSEFTYDGIGNRLTSTSPVLGNHGYTPNQLNQYGTVTTPQGSTTGYAERTAIGRAPAATTVQVLADTVSQTVNRPGSAELYTSVLKAGNASAPQWQAVETKPSGSAGTTRHFWYAKASISPTYDDDGNLLNDGHWEYVWDAENRLIQMQTTSAATTAGQPFTRLKFVYDWQGRRIAKTVWEGGTSSSPVFSSSRRWLYEGWNPIAEYSASSETSPIFSSTGHFVWGLDLSNTVEGAGGVGGLLQHMSGASVYRASYDGNGNIVGWASSTGSAPVCRMEYDAFGNSLIAEGTPPNTFGFSSKMQDAETGLYYYGFRYYDGLLGKWISRDPAGEVGGRNLQAMLRNNTLNTFDYLGLEDGIPGYMGGEDGGAVKSEAWIFWGEAGTRYKGGTEELGTYSAKWNIHTVAKGIPHQYENEKGIKDFMGVPEGFYTVDGSSGGAMVSGIFYKRKGAKLKYLAYRDTNAGESTRDYCVQCYRFYQLIHPPKSTAHYDSSLAANAAAAVMATGAAVAAPATVAATGLAIAAGVVWSDSALEAIADRNNPSFEAIYAGLTICADGQKSVNMFNIPVPSYRVSDAEKGSSGDATEWTIYGTWIHSNPGGATPLIREPYYDAFSE